MFVYHIFKRWYIYYSTWLFWGETRTAQQTNIVITCSNNWFTDRKYIEEERWRNLCMLVWKTNTFVTHHPRCFIIFIYFSFLYTSFVPYSWICSADWKNPEIVMMLAVLDKFFIFICIKKKVGAYIVYTI